MTIARAYRYDENGFFLEDLVDFDPAAAPDVLFTETPVPEGLIYPRFYNGEWVNGNAVAEVIERGWAFDEDGFFTEDLHQYHTAQYGPVYYTTVPCPSGFIRPRFNFVTRTWGEGHQVDPAEVLAQAKAQKLAAIEEWREAQLIAGAPYTFNGVDDVVQTRHQRDLSNIQARVLVAMQLVSAGVADAPLEFRAESDTSYTLTALQIIDMGNSVAAHQESIYKLSWQMKDSVHAATTIAEIDAIILPA